MPLVSKTFSQIITFTRASTATYFDATGTLQSAAIDVPRFDYDPATLAARGFLIEEARTNLLLQSEDLSTTWSLGDGTVTANSWTPPTGVATGDTYTIGTNATTPSQSATVVNSTTYAFSFYYNKTLTTAAFFRLRFGLASGSTSAWVDVANAAFGNVGAQLSGGVVTNIGNNIYRVSLQIAYGASDGGSRSIAIAGVTADLSTTADTGNDLAIWGAQLEAGSFPTSYIPTTTTALTRSADVASVNTLSPWYNATEGTVYADFSVSYDASASLFPLIASFDDNTTPNRIVTTTRTIDDRAAFSVVSGGVSQASLISTNFITYGVATRIASAYAVGDAAIALNGVLGGLGTPAVIPSGMLYMRLGNAITGGVSYNGILNGHLRRVAYYPRRLSNAELQGITA